MKAWLTTAIGVVLEKIGLRFESMVRPANEDADIKLFATEA